MTCPICGGPAAFTSVQVRGGRTLDLGRCEACDLEFFTHDPSEGLADDRLDAARLTSAGLPVPDLADDFANGRRQSEPYLDAYLAEGGNVLEIGCSWGYLLELARERGSSPYGLEVNRVRRDLVVVTPNLHDPLLVVWRSDAFAAFFHNEFSVNYFSPRALERLLAQLNPSATVRTVEGYSLVSHLSWFLTNAPRTTGVVGGDRLVEAIVERLDGDDVAKLVVDMDARYRTMLEERGLGNQLHAVVTR
ncbi:MAG TPA: hypothetical protein VE261_03765 [Gaiellaceae bacterium]|nr:hypothetical protein [Gaiellaceae bacterium]